MHATEADAARKPHFIREFKIEPNLTFTASFLSLYQPRMSVTGPAQNASMRRAIAQSQLAIDRIHSKGSIQ